MSRDVFQRILNPRFWNKRHPVTGRAVFARPYRRGFVGRRLVEMLVVRPGARL
jgi:hypothetical protein